MPEDAAPRFQSLPRRSGHRWKWWIHAFDPRRATLVAVCIYDMYYMKVDCMRQVRERTCRGPRLHQRQVLKEEPWQFQEARVGQ